MNENTLFKQGNLLSVKCTVILRGSVACFDEKWSLICTVLIISIVFGGSSSNTVGLIVGAILGGGGGLLVVAAVVYRCICKKTWRSQQDKYSVACKYMF